MSDSTVCATQRHAIVECVTGTLAADDRSRIAAHMKSCATCQREAAFWRATQAALDDQDATLPPGVAAEAAWQALRARVVAPVASGQRRMPWQGMLPHLVAALLLLALLGAGVYAAMRGQPKPGQTRIDQIKLTYASTGQLTVPAPFTTPEGLSIQLLAIERQPARWRFAFAVTNQADHTLDLLRSGADHRFVLVGAKPAGTPADQGEVILVSPAANERATHPALPPTVPPHATAQGWLTADIAALGYPPQVLLYRYATVHTTRCGSSLAWWTCQPADLYSAIEWEL
jgi:hypothetical protein